MMQALACTFFLSSTGKHLLNIHLWIWTCWK